MLSVFMAMLICRSSSAFNSICIVVLQLLVTHRSTPWDALVSQSASVVCIAVRVSRAAASQQRVVAVVA
jgi:hypothetical protein